MMDSIVSKVEKWKEVKRCGSECDEPLSVGAAETTRHESGRGTCR